MNTTIYRINRPSTAESVSDAREDDIIGRTEPVRAIDDARDPTFQEELAAFYAWFGGVPNGWPKAA
jgi:hypothetical protein